MAAYVQDVQVDPLGAEREDVQRVPRQLGYKSVKYVTRVTVTDRLVARKSSYSWYAGI